MSDLKPWEDTPICQRTQDGKTRSGGEWVGKCYGPLIPKRAADWNHRADDEHRLVCCACGEGQVGTDAEVEQAERAQRAWEEEEKRQSAVPSSTADNAEDLY